MDRKNHIIATGDCHPLAEQFIPFADEAFLVTLANKGLYKRALKDLEAVEQIDIAVSGECLEVKWEDVVVRLLPDVAQSACSCPSKTVCKHILMAILSVADYAASAESSAGKEETQPEPDEVPPVVEPWKALKEADIAQLRKQAGKKLFEDTLRLIQDGWTADFVEGNMLEATINTENVTVYFPKEDSLNRAVCKCGSNGLCKHKLIAILSYLSNQGKLSGSSDEPTALSLITDDTGRLLETADAFVTGILDKGLINCGENEVEAAIQFSVKMETSGIGNLARMFRSLSSDIENMAGKHVGFSPLTTFATLSRLHNTMRLVLRNAQNTALISRLIESTRSDYYTTPVGHFTALGGYPWQTRSGYFGITAYFFYHEKQSICTYTVSLAGYYEQTQELMSAENLRRQFVKNEHWGDNLSLSVLSRSSFTLRNFKMNRQNRLSSSVQTLCEITGTVDHACIQSFSEIASLFDLSDGTAGNGYDYFSKRQPEQLVLVPFVRLGWVTFNRTEQKLTFTMEKENEEPVADGVLDFNEMNELAIRVLETMGKHVDCKPRYMVCRKNAGGLVPVSIIGEKGIENFYF